MQKIQYNRIKEVLVRERKTSKELAEYMEVREPTVSNWCTNTNQPSVQDLYKIARFLKIDIRELLVPTTWNDEKEN